MSYLYSKLPETGVSPHIGTGGADKPVAPQSGSPLGHRSQFSAEDVEFLYVNPTERFAIGASDGDAGRTGE